MAPAMFSPVGCFVLIGSSYPATVVVTAGAPPRHAKPSIHLSARAASNTISFPSSPAAVRFGGALAGLPGFSLRPRPVPAGFLASNTANSSKGDRRLLVVSAGAASPGSGESGGDRGLPSEDCEAAVSAFRVEMALFRLSLRPVMLVESPTAELMQTTSCNAQDCSDILEFLVAKVPLQNSVLKELIPVGHAFLTLESETNEGYVKADALANAINGLKLIGDVFFEHANLPDYSAPRVPLCSDDVDKNSFFKELVNVFIVLYTALYWQAQAKHGFRAGGRN